LFWKYAVAVLNVFYIYDSMITWAVRAHDGFREMNPVIYGLQQINPLFYVAFRLGVLLLINLIIWQISLEAPESCESRWFTIIMILGIVQYTIPLAISLHIFV